MVTNIYIDGFNFYYGAVRGTAYKWLDFSALFKLLLPGHRINRIRYFTALVQARASDPQQPQRQQTYIRALQTIPGLSVHLGSFLSNRKRMPLATPPATGARTVEVISTEEKGSDVNLATYLIFDAMDGDYEVAVVVSNDSDLALPIRLVRQRFKMKIGLINPHPGRGSRELASVADFYKQVRRGPLSASQFPPVLADAQGSIHKPSGW